jgi:predicted component of type VI protein secretion system
LGVQSQQLPTESQVFEYDVLARHKQQVYLVDDYVEKRQGRMLPGEEEVLVKILDEHDVAIFLVDLGIEKPAAVRRHG